MDYSNGDMPAQKSPEPIKICDMKLRDLGNSFGFTVDKRAIQKLGLLDEDGELIREDIRVRSVISEDGVVRYEIPLDDLEEDEGPES